jgi:hypothetical protein
MTLSRLSTADSYPLVIYLSRNCMAINVRKLSIRKPVSWPPPNTSSAYSFHGTLSQRWADTLILKVSHPDEDMLLPSAVVGLGAYPL